MSVAVALLRMGLGGLLVWAAASKLPDMGAFAESVANYRLVPPALVPAVAAAVVGVEAVAGLLLVAGRLTRAASLVAAALLALFTAGLALALLRGIDLRCGCFGGQETATWLTVGRDLGLLAATVLVFLRGPGRILPARARGAEPSADGHAHGHGHGHGRGRGRHGNPRDFEGYLARLEDPERIAWQKPDEVVAALRLAPGAIACDLGVGPGTFALPMARAVGPSGRIHAIDVEPRMIEVLERRIREAAVSNVVPLLAEGGTVALPPEPCDVILLVNAFHHLPDPVGTLRRLATRLRPGGRIANVDFHEGELPVGPPPDQKVSREEFLAAAAKAGLEVASEETFLTYQYFVQLRPAGAGP